MDLDQNKIKFPGYPQWLDKAEMAFDKGLTNEIPEHILNLLALHQHAEKGNSACAEEVAEKYESGDLPCGACLNLAAEWHAYAAELGSAKSALRLSQLLLWMPGESDRVIKAVEMVKKVISNTLKNRYPSNPDLNSASAAALFILNNSDDEDGIALIEELIIHKKFLDHPEQLNIQKGLRLTNSQTGKDKLSLLVASKKITEDGDFKAGIYKILEKPLPLVGLPDPEMIKIKLNLEFPWFFNINEIIYRQLVVQQYSTVPSFKIRPLLLAGPPGVGKTSWARRLSELCNLPFRSLMAAGASDSMFLRGTPRGWSTARPGTILQTIASEGVANPLFLVDELEKASADSRNGRIWDVLLQLLEPATASVYLDECLSVPCNLSHVNWIATANEIGQLPKPLIERFTIVVLQKPGPEYFMTLVKSARNIFAKELNIDERMLPFFDGNDLEILRKSNGPRELGRTTRILIEKRLVNEMQSARIN